MTHDFERDWRGRFERFGHTHEDDAGISGWSPGGLQARFRHFRRSWSAGKPGQWLDAGCGPGTYTRYLLENGQRVLGVDYSVPSLQKARLRSPAQISWAAADVQHLPVRHAGFDGVLCFGVLQALSSPDAAIRELAGAVRPGGWLWVDALNDWCLFTRWRRLVDRHPAHPLRYDSPRRLRRLFESQGLTDVRVDWVPIAPGSLPGLQRLFESPPFTALLRLLPPVAWAVCHAIVVRGRRSA